MLLFLILLYTYFCCGNFHLECKCTVMLSKFQCEGHQDAYMFFKTFADMKSLLPQSHIFMAIKKITNCCVQLPEQIISLLHKDHSNYLMCNSISILIILCSLGGKLLMLREINSSRTWCFSSHQQTKSWL